MLSFSQAVESQFAIYRLKYQGFKLLKFFVIKAWKKYSSNIL